MKVSVVIPVYDVKAYLRRCVDSVLRQTYQDIEIIIVDDGSTDGSGELCDELASTDNRIIVIHQENQGLSGARNTGILCATGEYIIFLDSDDAWLLDNGLEQLIQRDNIGSDLIVFKNIDFWEKNRSTRSNDYDVVLLNQFPNAQTVFSYLVRTQALRISACFVLARRRILIDNNLFFHPGIISEDLTWSLQLWQYAKTVTINNLDFYGYYHRNNSITTTTSNTICAYHSYNIIFKYWKNQCKMGCVNAEAIGIFLADMWVSRGYNYQKLPNKDKAEALQILCRNTDFLDYAETPKARRAKWIVKHCGIRFAVNVLSWYWRLRNHIIV